MGWREDVKFGIVRADRLFLGTANGLMGTEMTTSAAELNVLDGVTAGVVLLSKAVVVDANKDIGDFRNLDAVNIDAGADAAAGTVDIFPATTGSGKFILSCTDQDGATNVTLKPAAMGQATVISLPDPGAATANVLLTDQGNDGVVVEATAAELNLLNGHLITVNELNLLDNMWDSIVTATTPASGTCAVQFTFKDAAGVTMATPICGTFYMSEVATGLTRDPADTGIAVLTNGVVQNTDAAVHNGWNFVTTAAGLLGITITAATDSYWIVFQHPTGKLVISDECVVNA